MTYKIKNNLHYVGALNPALRVFDIVMSTSYGTTYNAYLIKEQKNVLVETVHSSFFGEYLENLKTLVSISEIDYLIMNHNEPDHSGSIAALLELNPEITVIATNAGHKYLSKIINKDYKKQAVKDGDTLDIGNGKLLKFISAPMLHWPDTMFTYYESEHVLFSCDFLGSHYCEPRIFDSKITYKEKYDLELFKYYNAIFGPFKPFVLAGLDKIKNLEIDTVCTSHGPVLSELIEEIKEKYRLWSLPAEKTEKTAVIAYVSAYGYTKTIAVELADVLTKKYGIKCRLYNLTEGIPQELKEKIDASDAVILGTPTINRDALAPIWNVTLGIDAVINKGKAAAVFGSYGWSGEGVPMIAARLTSLGLRVTGDGLRINFKPGDEDLIKIHAYADEIYKNIL